MSWHGIRTVAVLELRQRVRTSRWPIVLAVWFGVIALVSLLAFRATRGPQLRSGEAMYDVVVFVVLGLAMLIVPSLTATSINGDREQGVLATLQTTLLTPWDLIVGKLVAAWAIALTFLATALPFLGWSWFQGGVSFGRVILSLAVLVLVLAVVCAVGLMFSTLTARPVASAVLTYLALGALVFGTLIGFGLSTVLVTEEEQQKVFGVPDTWWEQNQGETSSPGRDDCTTFTRLTGVTHTERIWWMLPLNPFVVVADAAPSTPSPGGGNGGFTPLRWISAGVRAARLGPDEVQDECSGFGSDPIVESDPMARYLEEDPVWPLGLGFLLVAGAGSVLVAARRLRTPIRRLPNGTRVA